MQDPFKHNKSMIYQKHCTPTYLQRLYNNVETLPDSHWKEEVGRVAKRHDNEGPVTELNEVQNTNRGIQGV